VSRQGLEEDREIWNRLDLTNPQRLTENDEAAVAFAAFCRRFHKGGNGR
jgi:hypothetical protein